MQVEAPAYERCEIKFYGKEGISATFDKGYFLAEAIGPEGVYCAGKSRQVSVFIYDFPKDVIEGDVEGIHNTLNEIIQGLTKQGWEYESRHIHFYSYRFRRSSRNPRAIQFWS